MKRWVVLVSVAALILMVGLGCSSKKKSSSDGSGGGFLTLTSLASPGGGTKENQVLPLTITLSANRAAAVIYYTAGAPDPADPDFTSSVYDPATGLTIDASFADGTYIIKFFAFYIDPVSQNTEQEYPFNTATYKFKEDVNPPTCVIEPPGGTFADPSVVSILIYGTDTHDTSDLIKIFYTFTNDGSEPESPKDAASPLGGTGPQTVSWASGTLIIRAYAEDVAGNQSGINRKEFIEDRSGWAYSVYVMIKADRDNAGITAPFNWMQGWADACTGHSEQIFIAERDGTLGKPDPVDHPELQNILPAWWNEQDQLKRELMDFDREPDTGYFIQAQATAIGTHANSPSAFYDILMNNFSAQLLDPTVTEFGCGFYENVWEAMWTYNP